MTNRERLIELLMQAKIGWTKAELADHLLANGVIVPPCKVGQTVYVITSQTSNDKNYYMFEDIVAGYSIGKYFPMMCFENHLGEPNYNWDKVFLTKEEAENALKGMVDNG